MKFLFFKMKSHLMPIRDNHERSFKGAATLATMTLGITTLSIMALSIIAKGDS
jgi:hypothetical protein